MTLIFTKNNSILSRIIRWGLKEPCSHFGVVFDGKFLMHSNLLGVQLCWLNTFLKKSEIVLSIDYDLNVESEEYVYSCLLNRFDGRGYDFGAFFYFAWRAFLFRFFKKPFPSVNKLNCKDSFLCTEIASFLPLEMVKNKEYDLISPYRLYLMLKGRDE